MTFQTLSAPRAFAPVSPNAPVGGGGPYGWLTPYVASLAAQNDSVAARVLMLRRAELHFIALVVSLMGDACDDADHFGAFARSYDVVARKKLVTSAAALGGVQTPSVIAKLPDMLSGAPWRPPTYLRLAALMNEPHARKTLRHARRVSRRFVLTLGRLPEPYRTVGVVKLVRRPRDLTELLFAIDIVRRVRTDLDERQIIASLERVKPHGIRNWVMRHYERVPFPPPPVDISAIGGVDALRPLDNYADLARAAREFDNCIRTYLWRVLKSDSYFYRYAPEAGGKGVAIVELRKAPVIGWVVHEALGPSNDEITGAHRVAVIAAFANAGVGAAPQASNPNAWFDLD